MARIASSRRRMRVVTGSSAAEPRLPTRSCMASPAFADLSALICSVSSETLSCGSVPGSGFVPERQALSRSRNVASSEKIAS